MTIQDLYTQCYSIKNTDLKKELIKVTVTRQLQKKELLFKQDECDDMLCFLDYGIAIAYEIESTGHSICLRIVNNPGDILVGGLGPMDTYSPISVEMQTDGSIFCIPMRELVWLLTKYPECMAFYNKILLQEYEKQWQINKMLYIKSTEERYRWFLQHYPGVIDKINHKAVASFLNMSPITLSRIINNNSYT